MKGLLRNNFYSLGSNLQLAFAITLILVFIPFILGEESMVSVVLIMQSFMFIANIGTALNTDITSKWSNFEVTLPVKRNDIIKAKYLSFLMLILCGICMCVLTTCLSTLIFDSLRIDDIIFGFTFGVSLSLLTSAFMYPTMLKIGTEKNELIIFISGGVAVALFLLVVYVVAPFIPTDLILSGKSLVGIIFTGFSIVLFILSYFISTSIYDKKEL